MYMHVYIHTNLKSVNLKSVYIYICQGDWRCVSPRGCLWLHGESRQVHIVDMLILPGNVVIWYCEAFQQPGLFYVVDCYNIIKSVVLINIPKYYWIANKELLNKRIQHYMFVECDQSYF